MSEHGDSAVASRGVWRVTGPSGRSHLLQAAPSGYVEWPTYAQQTIGAFVVHGLGMRLARLAFRGGWTPTVWRGDDIAPKREKVRKVRYGSAADAIAALEALAEEIDSAG